MIKTFIIGDTVLTALHVLAHLIFTETSWRRWYDYHSLFIDEETKAQQTKYLAPKYTANKGQNCYFIPSLAISYLIFLTIIICCNNNNSNENN